MNEPNERTDGSWPKERDIDEAEFVAGAPDWLFGRGCVKTLLSAPSALKHLARLEEGGGGAGGGGAGGGGAGPETCDAPGRETSCVLSPHSIHSTVTKPPP